MKITYGCFGFFLGMLLAGTMTAGAGTWTNRNGGLWNTGGNWLEGSPVNGAGSTANINANITAARTITNDTAVTLGTLNVGDSGSSYFAYTLTNSTGSLAFDSGSSAGTFLNFYTTSAGDTIASDFNIADNGGLTISNASANGQTISGVISGSKLTVNNSGAGAVTLRRVNTFTGGVTINAGTLKVTSAITNGTLSGGIGAATADAANLVINGGTLELNTGTDSSDRGITIGSNGGIIYYNGNGNTALTLKGPLALSGSGARTITLAIPASLKSASWNTDIGDNGGATALIVNNTTANGSSSWALNGNLTFTGGLSLTGGGGVLSLTGTNNNFSGVSIGAGSTLQLRTASTVLTYTFSQDITNNGTFSINPNNNTSSLHTIPGLISGSGTVFANLAQNGTIFLSNTNNSYTGKTSMGGNGGNTTLRVSKLANGGQNSCIGASTSDAANLVIGGNTGTSYLDYVGTGDSLDRLFTISGNKDFEAGILNDGSGTLSFVNTGTIVFGVPNTNNVFTLGGANTNNNIFAPKITDNGSVAVSFNKTGAGTWVLTGANTYSGVTTIGGGGVLGLMGAGTLGSGNLTINSGLLEASNDFVFPLGTNSGQMQITGGTSGFSARGNAINVAFGTVGSPTNLAWGATAFAPSTLVLNSTVADSTLTFLNPIDLNAATRTFQVNAATAILSSNLTTGSGTAGLTKTGAGTLVLSGNNTYNGVTTVSAGALRLASANGLPGGIGVSGGTTNLTLSGGVVELGAGDFTRVLGTGATNVQITAPGGGFSAYGAKRLVNLGGATGLVTWASGSFVPSGSALILNSASADSEIVFQNPINLNVKTNTVQVNDNPALTTDFATLSGVVTNGALVKTGAGTLVLGGSTNRFTGSGLTVSNGTLVVSGVTTSSVLTVVSNATVLINGSYTDPVAVQPGGTLGGTGTVAGASLTLGTLRVTIHDDGTTDALTVSSSVSLANAILEVVNTNKLIAGKSYTVLNGAHTGTFVGSNLPSDWMIDYQPTVIKLKTTRLNGTLLKIQ